MLVARKVDLCVLKKNVPLPAQSARCCGEVFLPPPSEAETKRDYLKWIFRQSLGVLNSIAFPSSKQFYSCFFGEGSNFEIRPN